MRLHHWPGKRDDQAAPARTLGVRRGATVEFLLTGGATLFLLPLAWLLRHFVGLDDAELVAGLTTFYAAYVINDPHFTVTYFLFYRDTKRRAFGATYGRAQQARFWVSGVLVPVALVGWAIVALRTPSAQALGWMVQLMYFLVGWHYVKQGFGVLTVLSARRGVRLAARERRAVLFHCFAGWAYAWANPSLPAGEYEEKGVVYRALAHPRSLELVAAGVLAASVVVLVATLAHAWIRERRRLPLAPLAGLLVTVWSWTIYSSIDPVFRYLIPALHAVQYFYFVWLLKRNEARASEGPPTFGRPVSIQLGLLALSALGLGLLLFRGMPTFLDAAFVPRVRGIATNEALGETPWFAAFFVVVNIHHYFMDHVVWRRENPETRWLTAPDGGSDVSLAGVTHEA